jgi:hypothetical protein
MGKKKGQPCTSGNECLRDVLVPPGTTALFLYHRERDSLVPYMGTNVCVTFLYHWERPGLATTGKRPLHIWSPVQRKDPVFFVQRTEHLLRAVGD